MLIVFMYFSYSRRVRGLLLWYSSRYAFSIEKDAFFDIRMFSLF